ncbi:HAD domain-containing protein [Actinoplanes sp. CA-252034]|uniref:HAD domain-containing protein n=1 Tax=Actinoplanes sp. CA-252034 TaxID=3239906 RepID=UPI003D9788FF
MKPVWLLDVDGVINAFRAGWWHSRPHLVQVWSRADAYDYRIRYEPRLVSAVRAVHDEGLAEVVWCTTWCSDADAIEEAFGLPVLPRAFTEPVKGMEACAAKIDAARRVVEAGRPLVWTDDVEVGHHADECAAWAADGRALTIAPDESRGLRPGHVRRIRAYLTGAPVPPIRSSD